MHINRYRRRRRFTLLAMAVGATALAVGGGLLFLRILRGAPVSVLPGIYSRGTVTIGVTSDTPPLGSMDSAGALTGFEADLARAIGGRLVGERAVVLAPVSNRTRAARLDRGYIDFAVAMISNVRANRDNYQLSEPYYTDPIGFLCRAGVSVDGEGALAGKKIGVFSQSLAHSQLKAHITDTRTPSAEVIPYTSFSEAAAGLNSGEIDAFCAERSILGQFPPGSGALSGGNIGSLSYCVAVRKGENDLKRRIDEIMTELREDGTLSALYQKYGMTPPEQ